MIDPPPIILPLWIVQAYVLALAIIGTSILVWITWRGQRSGRRAALFMVGMLLAVFFLFVFGHHQ